MKHRNKSLFLIATIFLASCAGRTPNPVPMYSPGDNALNCEGLRIQMGYAQEQAAVLLPKSNKTGSNIALGIAGAFLLVPWLFMDFSDADKVEMEAWRARYNYLTSLYVDKGCGERMMMPSLKQMKNDEEARDKWAEQVETDQEFLHDKEADNFDELNQKAIATDTSMSTQAHSMQSPGPEPILKMSADQYDAAKDRLLSLYTAGDINKADFDRELKQLDAALSAYKEADKAADQN